MAPRFYFFGLLSFNVLFQLLRFPHLILEHGGGAFLLLYFVMLNLLALPALITENVLSLKMQQIDLKSLVSIRSFSPLKNVDHLLILLWFLLRFVVLLVLFWFFLHFSGTSLLNLKHFGSLVLNGKDIAVDLPSAVDIHLSFLQIFIWVFVVFGIFHGVGKRFLSFNRQWMLPFCYLVILVLTLRIVISVRDFATFKDLFYPDFSALNHKSLLHVVGHSLICLMVGLGFYRAIEKGRSDEDPIEVYIQAVIQSVFLAILSGIIAIPMIRQVRETPFGSDWIFVVLPRWLSYGDFGYYYCALFYLCVFWMSFHMCLALLRGLNLTFKTFYRISPTSPKWQAFNSFLVGSSLGVVYYLETSLKGWRGQSFLLDLDFYIIDVLLPLSVLIMVWLAFRHTRRSERQKVFDHQQIFFHNNAFYQIWEKAAFYLVPTLIISSWLIAIF